MAYGRVVNVECKSKEDLITFRNKWSKWWPDNVHNALSRTSIRTSEHQKIHFCYWRLMKLKKSQTRQKPLLKPFLKLWQSMCMIYSHFTAK